MVKVQAERKREIQEIQRCYIATVINMDGDVRQQHGIDK